ncbi:hypothetical protein NC652_027630 [Populus alba x Populus x berolinensis]|nr:hypothetical protein NC652_027630 [Populus alba x Populus x berolinensis]
MAEGHGRSILVSGQDMTYRYITTIKSISSSGLWVTITSSSPSSPHPSSLLTSSLSFHLPLSPSICQSISTKLDYLYEVSLLDDSPKISETDLPLVNPYHAFAKKSPSVIRSIKTLIKQPSRVAKEYVQASSFDQHKFLLLLGNNLLLLKYQQNFQVNGFLKDTRIFILVLFG